MLKEFDGKMAINNIFNRYKFPDRYFNLETIADLDVAEKTFKLNNIPDLDFPVDLREMLFGSNK